MRAQFFVLIFLTSAISSMACLNEYHTLKNGLILYDTEQSSVGIEYWKTEIDTAELIKESDKFLAAYHRSDSLEYYSDYAVTLTYLGELERAKSIYLEIEAKSPNLYNTAANLGTVYELLGQNDSALYWIEKGIELNPESHEGSEWIHVCILKHKLEYGDEANFSVLGLDFGENEMPENIHNYDLDEYAGDIIYQLKERTLFVKPPNQIVGSLYADLADIMFVRCPKERHHTWLRNYYQAAETYEFSSPSFEMHHQHLNDLIKERARDKTEEDSSQWPITIGLILLLLGAVIFIWRRKAGSSL
jgi:LPXTG-motif cell wall-anchored protein